MGFLEKLKSNQKNKKVKGIYVIKTRYLKDDTLRKCHEFKKTSPLWRDVEFSLQVIHGLYIISVMEMNQVGFAHLLDYLKPLGNVKGVYQEDEQHYLYMTSYFEENMVEVIQDDGATYLLHLPTAYQTFEKAKTYTTQHDIMSWAHRFSLEYGYDVVKICEKEFQ